MEKWQEHHIQKNLMELIKNTDCNSQFIAELSTYNVLGLIDIQIFESTDLTRFEKSMKLYEILKTRADSYEALMMSLDNTRQSGALKILRNKQAKLRNSGYISYDKNNILGKGAFGTTVYRGKFDGKLVAVKVVNSDQLETSQALREIDILKELEHHENILRYYLAEGGENFVYVALELCDISLQDEVKTNMMKMDAADILLKCAAGLAHLHHHNIMHRDIKPANILLKRPNQVKISDFGLSKKFSVGSVSISAASGIVGTTDYMAPEVLKWAMLNEASMVPVKMTTACDIFALGCVFYFTLTKGYHAFGVGFQRPHYIVENKPQLDSSLVSADWMQVIALMISHQPEERPSAENVPVMLAIFQENSTEDKIEMQPSACAPEETVHSQYEGDGQPETSKNEMETTNNGNANVSTQPVDTATNPPVSTSTNNTVIEPWNGEWTKVAGVKVPRINTKTVSKYFRSKR